LSNKFETALTTAWLPRSTRIHAMVSPASPHTYDTGALPDSYR
jgi:hypothetical protein